MPSPADESERRSRGRPRDPSTDERILTATAALLRRKGFEQMTVDEVATEANVGKATIYRRWPSKDDLAVAAMHRFYAIEIPEVDTGTLHGDLSESFRLVLAWIRSPEGAAYQKMSIRESMRDDRIAALYRVATERAEDCARQMYVRAAERGELRDDVDLNYPVQWLGGLLAARAITGRSFPTEDEIPRLVEFALLGILQHGRQEH